MKPPPTSTVLQWLQLVVLTIGVLSLFTDLGRKAEVIDSTTADLAELKSIVHDLVKSQVTVAVNDARHQEVLDDLKLRVMDLERRTHAN